MSVGSSDGDGGPESPENPFAAGFTARVEPYEDGPDQLTIYPKAAPEDQRTTCWITASEGSFISLSDCR